MYVHLVEQGRITGILYRQFGFFNDDIEEGFELGKAEVFGTLRQIPREKVKAGGHIGRCQCFHLVVCVQLLKEIEDILISSDCSWLEGGSLVVLV
jgi:hypothetical protein